MTAGADKPFLHAGRTLGDWTLLEPSARTDGQNKFWLCRCSCGKERDVRADNLVSGMSRSCGHGKGFAKTKAGGGQPGPRPVAHVARA